MVFFMFFVTEHLWSEEMATRTLKRLTDLIVKGEWELVRESLLEGYDPKTYMNDSVTPLDAALTNPDTPIDIVQKVIHRCLSKKQVKCFNPQFSPVHQAAILGKKEIIQLFLSINADFSDRNTYTLGSGLAAPLYVQTHYEKAEHEVFLSLLPKDDSELIFVFVDVVCYLLKRAPETRSKFKTIIHYLLLEIRHQTHWNTLWLRKAATGFKEQCMIIAPNGVRGIRYTSPELHGDKLKVLLELLLLCGVKVKSVGHTYRCYSSDNMAAALNKFRKLAEPDYHKPRSLQDSAAILAWRAHRPPVTQEPLCTLGLPSQLQDMVYGKELLDKVMIVLCRSEESTLFEDSDSTLSEDSDSTL